MPVQDFECQIARSQIGRYLNGDGLSSEALRQLGSHVAECIGCKGFLDQRKAALQGMLGEAELPVRVEPAPEPEESMTPSESLIAQLKARSAFEEAQHKAAEKRAEREAASRVAPEEFAVESGAGGRGVALRGLVTKPIMYGAALVVVLIAMSYLSRNSNAILGPKVETTSTRPTTHPATTTPMKKATEGPSHPAPPTEGSKLPIPDTSSNPVLNPDQTTAATSMSTPVDESEASKELDHNQATGEDAAANSTPPAVTAKPAGAKPKAKPVVKPVAKPIAKTSSKLVAKSATVRNAKAKAKPAKVRRGKWRRRFHGPKAGAGTIHVYADGE